MHAVVRDARKTFQPGASKDYRETANEMGEKTSSSVLVREGYAKVLEMLEANLQETSLFFIVSSNCEQQVNFFMLQARTNTRLDDFLTPLCFNSPERTSGEWTQNA